MATFNKTCELTSRKYVFEQGMSIASLSEKNEVFWSHSSVFALEKQSKKVNFHSFLPLRDPLVATFNETCAPTSKKYVAKQDILMTNGSKPLQSFWFHSPVFALEKKR